MRYNSAKRELIFKIVYCGPGLAGKTTSLEFLHSRVPAGKASGLISIDSHSQRTLHFDFGTVELGRIQGIPTRLEFFTVPGQSYYAATRRNVLAGADGIVFVVDSRPTAIEENIAAMNEMLADLLHHQLPADLPIVLQYNKQDLADALPLSQLDPLLNSRGWKSVSSVAIDGQGVVEACELVAEQLAERAAGMTLPTAEGSGAGTAPPASWLITCHRCQSMLEVPTAKVGEVYDCAVCRTPLEIIDPDRGLTRRPAPAPAPADEYAATPAPRSKDSPSGLFGPEEPGSDGYPVTPGRPPTPGSTRAAAHASFPLPGFSILEVLDGNPQGSRLRVREIESDRTCRALVVAPALLARPGYRAQVEPYARRVGPIRHPNLLRMTSLRTTGGDAGDQVVFLADDPPDHEPLAHVLARRRALAPPHAIAILRQIALALEEAARHGAIHGWLRPEVILVDPGGHVLVDELYLPADHGFLIDSLAGNTAATEYYLAPEQFAEEGRADIGTDIFLLGALLFRMITGEGLVTGRNAAEALQRLHQEGPRALRSAQQGLSRELNTFYGKLVNLDRDQRYAGYRELLEALDRFGGGAKRQNLQLTARNSRRPAQSPAARTTDRVANTRSHRRPGSESHPPYRQPGGGVHTLDDHPNPTARHPRKAPGINILIVAIPVVVCLIMAVVVTALVLSRSRPRTIPEAPPLAARTPVVPPPAQPAVSTPPPPVRSIPEPVRVTEPATGGNRPEIRRRISELLGQYRWSEALAVNEQLTDPLDRQESEAQILRIHRGRRDEIERMLVQGGNPESIRKALAPFAGAQCLPGDGAWVAQMQARLETLTSSPTAGVPPVPEPSSPALPTVTSPAEAPPGDWGPGRRLSLLEPATSTPVTVTGGAVSPATSKTPITPATDPELEAYAGVLRALTAHQPSQAQRIAAALPAGSPVVPDLKLLITLWPDRLKLLNRVAATPGNRLRCRHPITDELVDVTQADDNGVALVTAKGGSSTLTWGQLASERTRQLFLDALAAPGRTPSEVGGAIAGLLAAQGPLDASALLKRERNLLGPQIADVEHLLETAWTYQAFVRLNQGLEAARNGNRREALALWQELNQDSPRSRQRFAADLARLEAAGKEPPSPVPVSPLVPASVAIPATPVPTTPPAIAAIGESRTPPPPLRDLGWEPLGDATLDGAAVRLPANTGIATAIPPGTGGYGISASGEGYLRLIALRGPAQAGLKGGLLVPLNPDRVTTWTLQLGKEKLTVLDSAGAVVQSLAMPASTATTLMIFSTGNAVLAALPGPR